MRGGGNQLRFESCAFEGGDTGVSVTAGGTINLCDCTFSRHNSSGVSISSLSSAGWVRCSVRESGIGLLADGCEQFVVEAGSVVRCRTGKLGDLVVEIMVLISRMIVAC